MNNIDFAEIRAEIDQQMTPPLPIEEINRNARRRNRKQVVMSGVAAVAVIAVGAGAAQVLTHRENPAVPLVGAPYDQPFPAGTRALKTVPVSDQISYALSQLPGDKGKLLWSTTKDGGRTWATREMPAVGTWDATAKTYFMEPPLVLTENTVVVDSLISHDGGTTWVKRAPFGASVSTLPDDWRFLPYMSFMSEIGRNSEKIQNGPTQVIKPSVVVMNPQDGSLHKFTSAPENCQPAYASQPLDGSIWLACNGGAVVSRDRGASWKAFHVLPEDADKGTTFPARDAGPIVSMDSADGRTGFLISRPATANAKSTIYRTADGGESWQKIRTVEEKPPVQNGELVNVTALADGSFLSGGGTTNTLPVVRSTDNGFTYKPLSAPFPTESPQRNALGTYYTFHWEDVSSPKNMNLMSQDGIHWTQVPVPPGLKAPEL